MRNRIAMVAVPMFCLAVTDACRSTPRSSTSPAGTGAPNPDIPSPAHRTPTITFPPATVSRGPTAVEYLAYIADSIRGAPAWRSARWGLLVVDPATGDTLLSRDADKLFVPASNQKLLTAAVAIAQLGENYRWRTPVLLRGRLVGDVFRGDLVLIGSGDPSWSDSLQRGNAMNAFSPVSEALRERGVRRIEGRIVAEGDALPGSTVGSGWEVEDLDVAFGAAIDELMLNEGTLRVEVEGGARVGDALKVTRSPTSTYPPVVLQGTTSSNGDRLRAAYDSTASAIVVSGSLMPGERRVFNLAYRHPNDAVRAAIEERLAAAGIPVVSTKNVGNTRLLGADTLVILESAPMADILRRMQKESQNQVAELLYRTVGRASTGIGSADSARVATTRSLVAMGVDASWVAVRDGSGMSRHNFATPRAIVHVLSAMYRSVSAAMYRDALPIAGVDGTLQNRMRGTAAQGTVRAKTGTLDKARSLSGYVATVDGRTLLFSILANNYTTSAADVDRAAELIVNALAGMRREQ